ncbi:MAG: AMP nucleosidase, partial [Pseudomonadota bacterium]
MTKLNNPKDIINELEKLYSQSVEALCAALQDYLHEGKTPDPEARASGAFCYPELIIRYNPDGPPPPISRAFGKMSEPGTYSTTITQPEFYRHYLVEQLEPLLRDYDVDVEVQRSTAEIPYAYVWEQGQASGLDE